MEENRQNQIILVNCSQHWIDRSWNYLEHLGLGYLKSVLKNEGFSVMLHDANLTWENWQTTFKTIEKAISPWTILIGFSVENSNLQGTLRVIQSLRRRGFRGHITIGGHFATFHAEKLLRAFVEIDTVILGYGELSLLLLSRSLKTKTKFTNIAGIAYIDKHKKFIYKPNFKTRDFIGTLGMPEHMPRYQIARVITSRGCFRRCSFCGVSHFDSFSIPGQTPYLRRKVDEVIEEIEFLVDKHKIKYIWISDNEFIGPDKRWMDEFAQQLINRNINVCWEGDCRADAIDYHFFKKLYKSGLRTVFLGVENFSRDTLDRYKKGYKDTRLAFKSINTLKKLGIIVRLGFIFFDYETTFDELVKNHTIIINNFNYGSLDNICTRLVVMPQTPLENILLRKSELCIPAKITPENKYNAEAYYTDYRFADERVERVHSFAISFRRHFSIAQAIIEENLRKGNISYHKHVWDNWKIRDLFGIVMSTALQVVALDIRKKSLLCDLGADIEDLLASSVSKLGYAAPAFGNAKYPKKRLLGRLMPLFKIQG